MNTQKKVKEVVVVKVSNEFVSEFRSAYAVALTSTIKLAQTICDAWHSKRLAQANLFASGEAIGKGMKGTDLSFPIIAEACAMAALSMDDAGSFLKGVSQGCGYGKPSSRCNALKGAGYEGVRKGAGGKKAMPKAQRAFNYTTSLKMNEKEIAAFKKMVAEM